MKKINLLLVFACLCCFNMLSAETISQETARTVALNFFKLNTASRNPVATLKYIRTEDDGAVDYYVFDIAPKGFVIVTADDILEPVIAYSTESNFNPDGKHVGVIDWMNEASAKIVNAKRLGITADTRLSNLWTSYKNGLNPGIAKATTVGPLLTTTWDQENDISTPPPYIYNLFCPFNSTDNERCVTGCVATAMAQVMKYWNYPPQGIGSYSYNDAPPSFSYNYGIQSANFGATTYPWATMPAVLTNTTTGAQDSAVDLLMYHAGVSVAMDYGDDKQDGSGAYVLQSEAGTGKPCAQNAYVAYFGYNPSTLKGLKSNSYTAANWITLIQGELNAGRVVQYQGTDPSAGGHTWVCDGYEANNMFHMNWGWGGFDNGYFSLTNLSVDGYNFHTDNGALIGIQPNTTTTCGVPSGLSTSAITTSTATFNWSAVTGATGYNLQYQVVGATSWTTATASTNSYNATGLTAGSNYQWQVAAVCSGGTSSYSSAATFATNPASSSCGTPTGLTAGSLANTSAALSWTAVSGATSYTLGWKLSSASTYTTVTGLTSPSYSLTGLTSCTAYQFEVEAVCSTGTSAYSTVGSFTTTGCTLNYCTSKASSTSYEYLKNVTLVSINHATASGTPGYIDNTAISTNLVGGSGNTITLTPGFTQSSYNEYFTVYIDYNHNGVFTDAGETVVKVFGKTAQSKSFTVPTTALNGATRMRIQMQYGAYQTNPCASYTYGQVQDYTVNITGNAHIVLNDFEQQVTGNEVFLYPNPAQNNITIQFSGDNEGAVKMNVYNIAGQRVIAQEGASYIGQNIQNINTEQLSNGVYIFEIDNNGAIQRRKFVIAK